MEQLFSKRSFRRIFKSCLIGLLLLYAACEIDHGLEPIRSKIGGKVFFYGDRNPDTTDEVRVAVIKKFPPQDITELMFSDIIFGNQDTLPVVRPWEIYLPPDTYEIVAVIWKENNSSWNISDIVGMYGGIFIGDQLLPPLSFPQIVIPSSNSFIDTLNIQANLNRVNRDATIEGTVTFIGTWPSNTGVVGIGAFYDIPQKDNVVDYLRKNVALDYSVPTSVDRADYRLRVRSSDALNYIAVMWIDNSYDLSKIKDIGSYRDPADPSKPGAVTLTSHKATGIDITVDFSKMGGG
jgi:hypothetical protein